MCSRTARSRESESSGNPAPRPLDRSLRSIGHGATRNRGPGRLSGCGSPLERGLDRAETTHPVGCCLYFKVVTRNPTGRSAHDPSIRPFGFAALRGLLGAEVLLLFGSFALGPTLWRAWSEGSTGPELAVILPNALACTLVLSTILIALGLYERRFWRGPADMLLRVGISFLFGLFALSLVGWLAPLNLGHGALYLALGLAGAGVLLARCGFLRAAGWTGFQRRVLVVGVGAQAARLERLHLAEPLGCRILGYVQVHEDEAAGVPLGRRLQVTHRLVDLARALCVDEIVEPI